jgi:hypothetical protein
MRYRSYFVISEYKSIGVVIFLLFSLVYVQPSFVFASSSELCSSEGFTLLTINGIFSDSQKARNNKVALQNLLPAQVQSESLSIDYILNSSHVGGIADIFDVASQGYFNEANDFDLTEMQSDASEKVTTQKILLVAHSEGNFYANNFYNLLVGKGITNPDAIGVYGVASPASYVAGKGDYITSSTDNVINSTRNFGFQKVLPANTNITEVGKMSDGHGFIDVYLKYRAQEIVSGIQKSLDKLKSDPEKDGNKSCISLPPITGVHLTQSVIFSIGDHPIQSIGNGLAYDGELIKTATIAVGGTVKNVAVGAYSELSYLTGSLINQIASIGKGNGAAAITATTPNSEASLIVNTSIGQTKRQKPKQNKISLAVSDYKKEEDSKTDENSKTPQPIPFTNSNLLPISDTSIANNVGGISPAEEIMATNNDPPPCAVNCVLYSQLNDSTLITGNEVVAYNLFTGASGHISELKFAYNPEGNADDHNIGLSIIDNTTSTNYYPSVGGVCGDAYASNGTSGEIIVDLDSFTQYREFPCIGPNLTLDPTHSYGVALLRDRGGSNTQRFYGSSDNIKDFYLYIASSEVLPISSDKKINIFRFSNLNIDGVIDEANHTINFVFPPGPNDIDLMATVSVSSGASISPSLLVPQDFTNPLTYTVTAEDGTTQDYIVTIILTH